MLNVGLCWAGSPLSRYDEHRTIPLGLLDPLIRAAPGKTRFYSLQQDIRDTDKYAFECLTEDEVLTPIGPGFSDFRETAHAMKCLDLVITVDTSVAHMAGTVGVPTWTLLTKFRTYWLWLQGKSTTPWYPSFTLFRQSKDGDWESVIETVRAKLMGLLAAE